MQRLVRRGLLIVAALAVFVVPIAVSAAGGFTDVPDDNTFKADIDWLAAAGVTSGCNPPTNDEFCPGDNVTREQMAAFMHRLAANKVVDAKTAVSAGDADTVGGKSASDLESHAYEASSSGLVTVPASSTTEVLSLDLPAGSYLIQARSGINSNMSGESGYNDIVCTLVAGADQQRVYNLQLGANGAVGETHWASWMLIHTFDDDGSASLSCVGSAAWSGNILEPAITAISVQSATVSPSTAGGSGTADTNG